MSFTSFHTSSFFTWRKDWHWTKHTGHSLHCHFWNGPLERLQKETNKPGNTPLRANWLNFPYQISIIVNCGKDYIKCSAEMSYTKFTQQKHPITLESIVNLHLLTMSNICIQEMKDIMSYSENTKPCSISQYTAEKLTDSFLAQPYLLCICGKVNMIDMSITVSQDPQLKVKKD